MHVIVVYDVPAERTHIFRKLLRRRLEHLQHSVFFRELTDGQVIAMKNEIEDGLERRTRLLSSNRQARQHLILPRLV
ncbi:CRISPR-associated endonuclease Cas2 [Natrinema soli]|uniref:CRISPR-associated endoribonuclease Cas2 n=1 Tax=Natrinema soli TaxID=1930624 RepID=A0ABD5SKA2_9EURY|nr:CRISPR-associated endonuclease Cas2 [Natrinema soli]